MAVIECNNVSIRYKTGNFKAIGLKEYLAKKITGKLIVEEFWADRDISFSLKKGDMLGIIGTNGAGKSTLLKAVCGIMEPAKGKIKTRGDIAAFLELATGFDPEMTIKENTYLRGAMLGYTREFMNKRYKSIIEFAELTEVQDYTFKQLSSGMKSRLAFSIAAQVEPDILILDEVLSVGDGAFRKKSGEKMKEILSNGVTGMLVSHSVSHIRELCSYVLWLDHGRQVVFSDDVEFYCDAYEGFLENRKKGVPVTREDFEELAEISRQIEMETQEKKNARRLAKLEKYAGETAVDAAIEILRRNRPEALSEDYLEEREEDRSDHD